MLPKIYIFKIEKINFSRIKLLPKSDLKKVNTYKNEFIKKEALASRLLLRYALMENGASQNILDKIRYGINGKPLINKYYFNISHSNDYAACAIYDKHIGLDIEKIDIRLQKNKHHFLSVNELKIHKARADITKVWTQKEALVKLKGQGINMRMHKIKINKNMVKSRKWHNYYLSVATFDNLFKFPVIKLVRNI